jgi:hypothetical protein
LAGTITDIKNIAFPSIDYVPSAASPRILWMDNARVISCFFVLLLHTSAGVVTGVAVPAALTGGSAT